MSPEAASFFISSSTGIRFAFFTGSGTASTGVFISGVGTVSKGAFVTGSGATAFTGSGVGLFTGSVVASFLTSWVAVTWTVGWTRDRERSLTTVTLPAATSFFISSSFFTSSSGEVRNGRLLSLDMKSSASNLGDMEYLISLYSCRSDLSAASAWAGESIESTLSGISSVLMFSRSSSVIPCLMKRTARKKDVRSLMHCSTEIPFARMELNSLSAAALLPVIAASTILAI